MDLTQGDFKVKRARAKKMMMWFAMGSITMMFAGLTSAYVVSKSRPDWIKDFEIPSAFFISTAVIVLSSLSFLLVKKANANGKAEVARVAMAVTLLLALAFVVLQFVGFSQIIESGFYFTGKESTVTTSFLYLIVFSHLMHVIGGVIVLTVVMFNLFRGRYANGQTLGLELGAMFWHFLDFLWVYLIVFFYFFR